MRNAIDFKVKSSLFIFFEWADHAPSAENDWLNIVE